MKRNWICFQIGAREHYAIERALLRTGSLQAMVTDIWSPPDDLFGKIPFGVGKKMLTRFHPELVGSNVIGFNRKALQLETSQRLKGIKGWDATIARNEWFQEQSVSTLKAFEKTRSSGTDAPVVFSYSYAAKKIFETAKRSGCTTVLGQIDPGPGEMKLVNEIETSHGAPLTCAPPPEYWQSWRKECELADVIVANSNWSRKLLIEDGVDADKIMIVPLVFDTTEKQACEPALRNVSEFKPSNPLRVLFLGQVIARKGVIELCEAVSQLSDQHVQWTIVGGGDDRLLTQLGQFKSVRLTGQLDRNEVEQQYRDADIFILPTHSDGFALTQLEAAYNGLPIVASKNCGDVVQDGQTGILLPAVSSSEIVKAIQFFLTAPEKLILYKKNQCLETLRNIDDLATDLASLVL